MILEQSRPLIFSYQDYLLNQSTLTGLTIGEYVIFEELGKGNFGKVYRATNKKGIQFALKLLDKKLVHQQPDQTIKKIKKRLIESQPRLMRQCNSPNLIKCLDIFQNQDFKLLIVEYCDGKMLSQELVKKKFSQREAVDILRHIINGIAELHRNSIVHRDLKTDNIMRHEGIYKIIDFGFSKKLHLANEAQKTKNTVLGTPTTIAPQVMLGKKYGLKADIWSIGIIFFEIVFGIQPYDSMNAHSFFYRIQKSFNQSEKMVLNGVSLSSEAHDFLRKVLRVNPDQRLGWRQMIEHPLIKIKDQEPITSIFLQRNKLEEPIVSSKLREGSLLQKQHEIIQQNPFFQCISPKIKFNLDKLIEDEKEQKQTAIIKNKNKRKSLFEPSQKPLRLPIFVKSQQPHIRKQSQNLEYRRCLPLHLECLKTELIYKQIFEPIENRGLIDLSSRQSIQFLHLLISRCFKNLSPLKEKFKNNPQDVHRTIKNLDNQVQSLYKKVSTKFQDYDKKLLQIENNYTQITKDFFLKLFSNDTETRKNKLMGGVELRQDLPQSNFGDYTKMQQINFTCQYINNILPQITILGESSQRVKKHLLNYASIMKATVQQLGEISFSDFVHCQLSK